MLLRADPPIMNRLTDSVGSESRRYHVQLKADPKVRGRVFLWVPRCRAAPSGRFWLGLTPIGSNPQLYNPDSTLSQFRKDFGSSVHALQYLLAADNYQERSVSLASLLRLNWFNLESPQELGPPTVLLSGADKRA